MNLFCWHKKSVESEPLEPICKGQRWVLTSQDGDPWPSKYHTPVRILDTRPGWVRYGFDGGWMFTDCRMEEHLFRAVYMKLEDK